MHPLDSAPPGRPPASLAYARFLVRRRRLVAAVSVALTLITLAVAAGALGVLSLSRIAAPGSESDQARAILADQFRTGPPNLVFLVDAGDRTVDDPATRTAAEQLGQEIAAQPGVAEVGSYWSRGNSPALRSEDGRQALILIRVPGEVNEARARVGELATQYAGQRGPLNVRSGGQDEVFREIGAQARQDFLRAEAIVIPLVLLLLILIYRRVALALITLGVGVFATAGSLAGLRVIASFTEVSTFAANLALVMGLALGVDYCLFVISRYREELAAGNDVAESVVTAVRTAGRTVFFSGLTVACSLLALLLFPLSFLRSFGYAGVLVVGSALIGSLVMLPAALAILGRRAARPTVEREVESGWWFRIARLVMRRPLVTGGAVLAVVLLLAAPAIGLRFGLPDARILPADASSRITADEIRSNFGQEESDAIYLVARQANDLNRLPQYAEQLSRVDGVAQVDSAAGVFVDGNRVIPPTGDRTAPPTTDRSIPPTTDRFTRDGGTYLMATPTQDVLEGDVGLVDRLRAVGSPYDVMIGGSPAEMLDWRDALTERIPLVLGLILVLSFAVLQLATGSVLLPLKATVLNLLSLGVMFGVMVWVFQDGNLAGVLGFTPTGVLEASMPLLMFCIVYGLSMDYEVFIVSRIREEYLRTGDNSLAVATGLQRTAPLVSTAAAVLALSFAVYATGGVVYLKMIGVGMAVAVLVDATVIRGVLLPAAMKLAGRANWWMPAVRFGVPARRESRQPQ
ncbi:RND superfamily putative drug exporter [Kribbella sp. VKM Ac-2527]|uniref:RND superfamily putative drug exporter n=1 Tax=Kribbella caucasensis TaxID=2512215 RepID=A0A4R6KIE9_9ACTN|nr:MMPL family transporter [Kribbella sp. VKM Ac-2527]TDO50804.1 RND superfamily putative drug exporter [Kribbella sp. VKM Ac-2527]